MDYSKLNKKKCIEESKRIESRLVTPIYFNFSLPDEIRKNILDLDDIKNNGFNIEKLYHVGKDGNRTYFNTIEKLLSPIFKKTDLVENDILQPKTNPSLLEKINNKFIKKGNRDFLKNGYTIIFRIHSGTGDIKLDGNIDFIEEVLSKIDGVRDKFNIIKIKTNFNGDVKKYCVEEYEESIREGKNLIILYGQKLDTGIDLPEINPDVFINLSNLGSIDLSIQILGRFLRYQEGKKFCFVIDFNISNILKSVYYNKKTIKTQNEYEFVYEYKDNIFNINNGNIEETNANYIQKYSDEIKELLNEENSSRNFFINVTNNATFDDIYYNKSNKRSCFKNGNGEEIKGSSKEVIERIEKGSNGVDNTGLSEKIKNDIKQKVEIYYVVQEIFRVYEDVVEDNCKNVEEIIKLIFSNKDYLDQFKHFIFKMNKNLGIDYNDDIFEYMINSIDYSKFNNSLLYSDKIEPMNRNKIDIEKLLN